MFKMSITFNIALRRLSGIGVANGVLHGLATYWRCLSSNCGDELISDMQYERTAFSVLDD